MYGFACLLKFGIGLDCGKELGYREIEKFLLLCKKALMLKIRALTL